MVNGKGQDEQSLDRPRSSKRTLDGSPENARPDGSNTQQSKRSRVSRACDQCRASRERCDGSQPRCQTCSSQSRACSYNEQPKKRGIQPNYIRTLEVTLAWIFQTFPATQTRLANSLPDEDRVHELISGQDPTATETLHLAWRNCIVNRQIDQILSGTPIEKPSLGIDAFEGEVDYGNAATNSTPLSGPSDQPLINATPTMRHKLTQMASTPTADVRHSLPDTAWTLLEYYFAFTHSWLPMTEKHSILKVMYAYPPEGLLHRHMVGAEHAELWAILALAATQLFEEENRHEINPIRQLAESLIPIGGSSYELPHIKAMILLALADAQEEHMLAAWLRIGCVVRLLCLFKLLQSLGQVAKWCRHIHLVAFIVESALALHLKTYGHLGLSYIKAVGLIDEDGLEEWSPWSDPLTPSHPSVANRAPARSFSTLNKLVRIYIHSVEVASTAEGNPNSNLSTNDAIFWSLLKNAASKRDRVQPSALLAMYATGNESEPDRLTVEGSSVTLPWTLPDQATSQAHQNKSLSVSEQPYPFMSIPNEPGTTVLGSSPANPNPASFNSASWLPDAQVDPAFHSTTSPIGLDGTSMDIFEELASLDRHDSTQQPQFLRNLGFPDLELAEFFGPDYQASDPLLAYLQPTVFGAFDSSLQVGTGLE